MLAFESGLLTAEGRLGEALARLIAYEAAENAHALATPGYHASDLSLYRQSLARAAGRVMPDAVEARAPAAVVAEPYVTGIGTPYPNPARSGVSFALTLAEAGRAEAAVYDVTGRRVATVVSSDREAGTEVVELDTSGLAPGLYLVRGTVSSAGGSEPFAQRFTVVR